MPRRRPDPEPLTSDLSPKGTSGWDEYAPFYDWENAQTLGRRDVPFWRRVTAQARGPVLELGCGTGRISVPLARAGVRVVGVDYSAQMLERARRRVAALTRRGGRSRAPAGLRRRLSLIRGDIRALSFRAGAFAMVLAPYGILQSLLGDTDLSACLSEAARIVRPGGLFGVDLVPDVPRWKEYKDRVQLRGRTRAGTLTLVESVRQNRRKRLTTFEQSYILSRGRKRLSASRFELTFRTLSLPDMTWRIEQAGFAVEAVLGDYRGRAWDERADVWIILARKAW